MKNYHKSKELSYLYYWDINNLHEWAMSQKLSVDNFEWIKRTSQFNQNFIKRQKKDSDKGYFFEVDVQHPGK